MSWSQVHDDDDDDDDDEEEEEEDEEDEGAKKCFKLAKNLIWLSWDSKFSYKMYMSLQLQNHMGLKVRSSWRVTKKNSKLPCWGGFQKNRTQLLFFN